MDEIKCVVYLVMVTGDANNNKYYKMIPKGDSFIVEYGRVGSSPQTRNYSMYQWDTKYNEKIKKGYVDQTSLIADLIEVEKNTSVSEYKEIENKSIADIVKRLQAMANKSIQDNYNISSNKVTKAMVDEAQNILVKLMDISQIDIFNKILIELFGVIPRKMGRVSDYLANSSNDFSKIMQIEQDLLDVMKGQVVQKQIEDKNKIDNECKDEEIKPHTILDTLGLEFEECTDLDIIKIKSLLGSSSDRFLKAWKVKNKATQEKFDTFVQKENIQNIKLLWHGSRNENWWSIANSGLILRPTNAVITGKMFGYGIYFAPSAKKSLGYTSLSGSYWANGSSKSAFMALLSVAYGKPYDVYFFSDKFRNFTYEGLQSSCKGANSLHAHAGSMLHNDEIIVYRRTGHY